MNRLLRCFRFVYCWLRYCWGRVRASGSFLPALQVDDCRLAVSARVTVRPSPRPYITRLPFSILSVWCCAVVLSGSAPNLPLLFLARVLSGVGEASFQTVVPPYIDDTAPKVALFVCLCASPRRPEPLLPPSLCSPHRSPVVCGLPYFTPPSQ